MRASPPRRQLLASQFIATLVSVTVATLCGVASAQAELRDHRDPVAASSGATLRGDCVVDLALAGDSRALIRYTISCAVQDPEIVTAVEAGDEQELIRISRRISPQGPGGLGHARCAVVGSEVICRARRTGPVRFEGWLMVEPGTRCRDRFSISVKGYLHHLYPLGCPDAARPPLPSVAEIVRFRGEHGLDLDLSADSALIEARAIALREALRLGDPSALVARRTWGVPLRAVDLRELEYRLYYNLEGSAALHEWLAQNARDTYAGHWIDEPGGGAIYVRFTGDQEGQVAALRSAPGILAPERIVGYGVPALYSLAELGVFKKLVADLRFDETWNSLGLGPFTGLRIDIKENKVRVGTCNPEAVAPALSAHFGPEAPFTVVYRRPPELKPKRMPKTKSAAATLTGVKPLTVSDIRRRICEARLEAAGS